MTNAISQTNPAIYSSLGSDPDLAELVELFVAEMPGRIEQLRQQYHQSDWERLGRTAHQLKGAAGSYGFEPLSPIAGQLEIQVRGGAAAEQIQQTLDELLAISARLRSGFPA